MLAVKQAPDTPAFISAAFAELEKSLEGLAAGSIHEQRKQAFVRFLETGLPPAKSEAWKYTKAAPFLQGEQVIEPHTKRAPQGHMALMRQGFLAGQKANILCTLNGRYEPTLSTICSPIHEVELTGMQQAERLNSRSLAQYFGKVATADDNPFVDVNTALCTQGIIIRVPEGKNVRAHTYLYHLADATQHHPLAQPRVLVVVGAGSTINITEVFEAQGGHPSTTNYVLEVYLAQGATCNLTKVQKTSSRAQLIDSSFIHHEAGARSQTITLSLSGQTIRNNLTCVLAGAGAHADLQGLYLCQTGMHVDNHTEVKHMVPDCTSNELYKGVVDGKGVSVFNGKIYVAKDAQKTNAFQSNRNLLLSDEGVVNTKPQLEIYADDVRCTHGATIGQLPEDALFYMQARGISKEAARGLLLGAFAQEVANQIPHAPTLQEASRLLESWFAAR